MEKIDIHKVMDYLPHRYPFLLVDRVIDYKPNEWLKAIKNVTINEPFFPGHFPHRPVMPGVLIIEAIAQSCAILAGMSLEEKSSANRIYYFAGVDKARFKQPVEPGDRMDIEVRLLRKLKGIWKSSGEVKVDGKLCCSAELMFTYKEL